MNSLVKFFVILIAVSMTAQNCNREKLFYAQIINVYWQHSFEDDSGDTLAYRPKVYDFPPSRGREGFEFKENGVFYHYAIAPTDGINTLEGNWEKAEEENTFVVRLRKGSANQYPMPDDYKIKIVDFDENEMVLKIIHK